MRLRPVALALALALVCTACRATSYTAISMPKAQTRNDDTCFADCQPRRERGSEEYLACVRHCPGVSVQENSACGDIQAIPNYVCAEEQGSRFSVGRTVALVGSLSAGAVVAAVAISVAAAAASASATQ